MKRTAIYGWLVTHEGISALNIVHRIWVSSLPIFMSGLHMEIRQFLARLRVKTILSL